jgi:hypothetical protein
MEGEVLAGSRWNGAGKVAAGVALGPTGGNGLSEWIALNNRKRKRPDFSGLFG